MKRTWYNSKEQRKVRIICAEPEKQEANPVDDTDISTAQMYGSHPEDFDILPEILSEISEVSPTCQKCKKFTAVHSVVISFALDDEPATEIHALVCGICAAELKNLAEIT